jgi:hypothetical protein
MAKGWFGKVIKGLLIGAGTVLSLIPGVGPVVGGGLIVAGTAIKTNTTGSSDIVSEYGAQIQNAFSTAGAMQSGANVQGFLNNVMVFVQKYAIWIIAGVGLIFFLPKLFKGRRR